MMKFYVLLAALLCFASGTQSVEVAEESTMSRNLREVKSEFEISQSNSVVFKKPECTLKQRLDYRFRRTGEVLASVAGQSTPERCALYCAISMTQCVAINYDTANNVCYYLKTVTGMVADSNFNTALLSSSLREICSSANIISRYGRVRSDLPGNPHILHSAEECCGLCYITEGCIAYDFHSWSNECNIKNDVPALTYASGTLTGIVCPFAFG